MGNPPRRVLVVEDDEIIRHLLSDLLEGEGYDVRTATNGLEGLAALEGWSPDVIVLDLMLPVMDGAEFRAAQRLRPEVAAVPVLLLSAANDLNGRAASLEPAAVMAKPFDLDQLLETLARLVAARPALGPDRLVS